jgi:hypothetical protein
MGQVMARMQLTWLGEPGSLISTKSSFKVRKGDMSHLALVGFDSLPARYYLCMLLLLSNATE